MLEYLEQLIKEQKWEEALVIAEQLVQRTDNSVEHMVRINLALIIARCLTAEHAGVVTLGDHALSMAADVGDWDAFLTMCNYIAFSHVSLNQRDQAQQYWLKYIEHLSKCGGHHIFEINTWFNLGVNAILSGDYEIGVSYYEQAKRATLTRGTKRQLLGVNHALIHAYTGLKRYDRVPPLLAQTAHYLRHNRGAEDWLKAMFLHNKVRSEFALATRRFRRAELVATRCLEQAANYPEHRYYMHIILANVARESERTEDLATHLALARVAAIRARRYDYELYAAEGLYQLIQAHPDELLLEGASTIELPSSWFDLDDSSGQ